MMDLIRALIKESFLELREDGFAQDVLGGVERPEDREAIIGSRSAAMAFARTSLMVDIHELSNYELSEYMPIGHDKEKWTFEAETSGEHINVVSIKHAVIDGISTWNLVFGQAIKSMEAMTVEAHYKTGAMPDYDSLVRKANEDWQKWG